MAPVRAIQFDSASRRRSAGAGGGIAQQHGLARTARQQRSAMALAWRWRCRPPARSRPWRRRWRRRCRLAIATVPKARRRGGGFATGISQSSSCRAGRDQAPWWAAWRMAGRTAGWSLAKELTTSIALQRVARGEGRCRASGPGPRRRCRRAHGGDRRRLPRATHQFTSRKFFGRGCGPSPGRRWPPAPCSVLMTSGHWPRTERGGPADGLPLARPVWIMGWVRRDRRSGLVWSGGQWRSSTADVPFSSGNDAHHPDWP